MPRPKFAEAYPPHLIEMVQGMTAEGNELVRRELQLTDATEARAYRFLIYGYCEAVLKGRRWPKALSDAERAMEEQQLSRDTAGVLKFKRLYTLQVFGRTLRFEPRQDTKWNRIGAELAAELTMGRVTRIDEVLRAQVTPSLTPMKILSSVTPAQPPDLTVVPPRPDDMNRPGDGIIPAAGLVMTPPIVRKEKPQ